MAIHDCFFVVLLCNARVDELCGLLSGNLLTRGAWSQGIPVVNRAACPITISSDDTFSFSFRLCCKNNAIPLQNIVNC